MKAVYRSPEQVGFEQALEWLKLGRAVYRRAWKDGCNAYIDEDGLIVVDYEDRVEAWEPLSKDLLATDWVVSPDEDAQ